MPQDQQPITRQQHEQLARQLFNRTWALLDKPDRTPDENEEMLHTAHASRYHWGQVGGALHRGRGEWQISRVNAVLGRPDAAMIHARLYLALCERGDGLGPFDLVFAHEAIARAAAIAGNRATCEHHLAQAREVAAELQPKDRAYLLGELDTIRLPE